jgi:hypothetical protein
MSAGLYNNALAAILNYTSNLMLRVLKGHGSRKRNEEKDDAGCHHHHHHADIITKTSASLQIETLFSGGEFPFRCASAKKKKMMRLNGFSRSSQFLNGGERTKKNQKANAWAPNWGKKVMARTFVIPSTFLFRLKWNRSGWGTRMKQSFSVSLFKVKNKNKNAILFFFPEKKKPAALTTPQLGGRHLDPAFH